MTQSAGMVLPQLLAVKGVNHETAERSSQTVTTITSSQPLTDTCLVHLVIIIKLTYTREICPFSTIFFSVTIKILSL